MGQATVWYAKPNTGKTLISLALLREAVGFDRLKGGDAYYVNADDNSSGIAEKLDILEPYGINLLCQGWNGFDNKKLFSLMREMIDTGTAKGTFLILDVMKKFVSLMDKKDSSAFGALSREFVMKGGSLLGLAHTNKRAGEDGRPIYAGTSDILDDFDCGYTIEDLSLQQGRDERVVQFNCIKRRGNVAQQAAYSYALDPAASYLELLNSVTPVEDGRLEALAAEATVANDQNVIDAIEVCIAQGIDSKIEMMRSVAITCKVGQHSVGRVIDRYTGSDPEKHRWNFTVGAHGKWSFRRLLRPGEVKGEEQF